MSIDIALCHDEWTFYIYPILSGLAHFTVNWPAEDCILRYDQSKYSCRIPSGSTVVPATDSLDIVIDYAPRKSEDEVKQLVDTVLTRGGIARYDHHCWWLVWLPKVIKKGQIITASDWFPGVTKAVWCENSIWMKVNATRLKAKRSIGIKDEQFVPWIERKRRLRVV